MRRSVLIRAVLFATTCPVFPAVAADHWLRLKSAHFEMYTNSDEKKAHDAIMHFERVREFFMQASPVRPPAEFPTRIVAFRDPEQFLVYSPRQDSMAFMAPGPRRDTIVMEDPSAASYPVTIHEYVHVVIRHSGLKIPLWLNEGWAEVYSTLKPVKDGVAVGDLIPQHMKYLEAGVGWFGLNELAAINNRSPDYRESNRTGMFYAESWALTHMLYLAPDYKNNFGKFIKALNGGRSMADALQFAFSKSESQVFLDLRSYLARKKLYGTVFLTPLEKSGEAPVIAPIDSYDTELMVADLASATGHGQDAERDYRQLETESPNRPDAFEGSGYLALAKKDAGTARSEFAKAFALGSTDPLLCMQLATLDHEANQPRNVIMEELERAVKLQPDFPEAELVLGLMRVDNRDFDGAIALLGGLRAVPPERALAFHTTLSYASLQKGNLEVARDQAELSRKAATSPAENQQVDRLQRLIDARSKGPAAVQPGDKLMRVDGTAVGLRCAAQGSGELSHLGIALSGSQMQLDLPDAAAVEIERRPGSTAELKCGQLDRFPLTVEYSAAGNAGRESAGIIRRLEF